MKRKRMVAWAAYEDDMPIAISPRRECLMVHPRLGERAVKLVEHDPAAEAVVRAAVKLVNQETRYAFGRLAPEAALMRAVERYERKRGKR